MRVILFLVLLSLASALHAQDGVPPEQPMTMARLAEVVKAIDPEASQRGPTIEFTIQDVPVIIIADAGADRMRAMVPIRSAEGLSEAELMRLMQANFDSALDARYAVAQGRLWGVFIHPLSRLGRDQLVSGLVQTVNVALTYGQTYSGGVSVFGGGDSNGLYQDLLDKLGKQDQEL